MQLEGSLVLEDYVDVISTSQDKISLRARDHAPKIWAGLASVAFGLLAFAFLVAGFKYPRAFGMAFLFAILTVLFVRLDRSIPSIRISFVRKSGGIFFALGEKEDFILLSETKITITYSPEHQGGGGYHDIWINAAILGRNHVGFTCKGKDRTVAEIIVKALTEFVSQ